MGWVFCNTNKRFSRLNHEVIIVNYFKADCFNLSEVNNHYTKSSIGWSQYSMVKITHQQVGGGGTLVCQAGYHLRKRTFKTHPKHEFSGMKIDPNHVFACVFLNLSAMSFPKFVNMTKNHYLLFSGMKIDPINTCFCPGLLHAFFLICPPCHFQNLSIWPKTHHFFPIIYFARFCSPKRCTRVHYLVLKNNPNYIFFWGWYPTSNTSVPPRVTQVGSQNVLTLTVGLCNSIGTVAKLTTFIFNYGWW